MVPTVTPLSRTSLTSGPTRVGRAVVVAVLTVLVATGCHVLGGGSVPSAPLLAVMLGGAVPICWTLSAHRWSVLELAGVFLLAQSAVHLLSMTSLAGGHAMGAMGISPLMVGSHLVGGLALVVSVRWGEHVLWAMVDALALRPLALVLRVVGAPRSSRSVVGALLAGPATSVWPHVASGRAPPLLAAPTATS